MSPRNWLLRGLASESGSQWRPFAHLSSLRGGSLPHYHPSLPPYLPSSINLAPPPVSVLSSPWCFSLAPTKIWHTVLFMNSLIVSLPHKKVSFTKAGILEHSVNEKVDGIMLHVRNQNRPICGLARWALSSVSPKSTPECLPRALAPACTHGSHAKVHTLWLAG